MGAARTRTECEFSGPADHPDARTERTDSTTHRKGPTVRDYSYSGTAAFPVVACASVCSLQVGGYASTFAFGRHPSVLHPALSQDYRHVQTHVLWEYTAHRIQQ